ncbi:Uncharacterised protein [Escherichia coli]|nr:Uncharacterised protein [Escherichia coli]
MHSTPTNLMTTASLPVDRPFFAYQHEWNSAHAAETACLQKCVRLARISFSPTKP